MRRAPFALPGLAAAVAGILMLAPHPLRAADTETRVYSIQIDGKKAGDYQLTIQRQDDGTVNVSAVSNVRVTVLAVPVYTYTYRGREVWKGGRLQVLDSSGKEKSKEFTVRADLDGASIRVRANGQERRVRADVWTTSCWQLPEASFRNNAVAILGCDSGTEIQGRLDFVGNEEIKIAGQPITCARYKVTKDVPHDVWYDSQERLVRDEWVSGGHRTVVELIDMRR